jgi:hypothetical protein
LRKVLIIKKTLYFFINIIGKAAKRLISDVYLNSQIDSSNLNAFQTIERGASITSLFYVTHNLKCDKYQANFTAMFFLLKECYAKYSGCD